MGATATIKLLAACSLGAVAMMPTPSSANVVNVDCYGNGDGTVSCQRLRDGEWFDCASSVGGVSTCKSREVVHGHDAPITCTEDGGGIFSCTSVSRQALGDSLPSTSVFGF
jgi:hypothetical protein